ncbi:bacillithiol biosynthesis deacetylase BshB1 [Altibacter sp. HG106]|uniref:bacillithiol biosynthesis deacetylase BshB1 n=1 Tax=Altibacter sp. HG106 TaxID=3023937 RepID=UPI002350726C|nr:bacillithiol biosynthesis deacetylase BshB1 [Altibacter sp. HG106]MDC7995522.1 bacillithiol biosynthesis deacetylase BshB1 [Altibacter sp. HG106]
MKLDILAIGAHPDDVEMSCGATLAKEISRGKKVGILDLTRGELGTRGTPEIREKEAAAAAEILGVEVRENLQLDDGFFNDDKDSQLAVIEIIRKYQPEIILANAVDDRHIDHGRAAELVRNACFLSGLRKIETVLDGNDQKPWRPKQLYHYIQWKELTPDIVFDVSGFMEVKMKAVMAYKSQFYDKNSKEPETPISSKNATDSLRYRNQNLGRLIGTEAGEGFTKSRILAVSSVFDLI